MILPTVYNAVKQINRMTPITPEFTLSIIILTYNNSNLLGDILTKFSKMTSNAYNVEVIIIDNGCFESTLKIMAQSQSLLSNPPKYDIKHLQLCNNTQYATAYNLGVQTISPSSTWLLLLNDDVIPRESFLNNFYYQLKIYQSLHYHDRSVNFDLGAIGCKLLFPNHRIVEAGSVIRADGGTDNFLRQLVSSYLW